MLTADERVHGANGVSGVNGVSGANGTRPEPHPYSFADPHGRLFHWRGELYRGVGPSRADLYRQLVDTRALQRLFAAGLLIDTEIAPIELDGYPLVLKHRRLPFVTYAFEWPAVMLKTVAYHVLELETELATHGLTLHDVHPFNVLFDGPRSVYVDFASIWPEQPAGWHAYDEFLRYYINPLLMMDRGQARLARWLLHDHLHGVFSSDVRMFDPNQELGHLLRRSAWRLARAATPEPVRQVIRRRLGDRLRRMKGDTPDAPPREVVLADLRQRLEPLARQFQTISMDAPDDGPPLRPSPAWTAREQSVFELLAAAKPATVLDVGCGRGWYARLAASMDSQVVAFDWNEAAVTELFHIAQRQHLSVVPLLIDFQNPAPGYGLCNEWLAPASERLASELVLALGVIDDMLLRQKLPLPQVVRGLAAFCKRWLLVEFDATGGEYGVGWPAPPAWYSLDNFVGALRQQFRDIRVLPSYPESRVLLMCER